MTDTGGMLLFATIAGIAAAGALIARFGADSRPGFDESAPLS